MKTERWHVMDENLKIASFTVDIDNMKISDYIVYIDENNLILQMSLPFYVGCKEPTWSEFMDFVAERLPPESRVDIENILEEFGLNAYDCLALIHKTRGIMAEDFEWVQFDDENLRFEDIDLMHRSGNNGNSRGNK